jgi:hypothetical protein
LPYFGFCRRSRILGWIFGALSLHPKSPFPAAGLERDAVADWLKASLQRKNLYFNATHWAVSVSSPSLNFIDGSATQEPRIGTNIDHRHRGRSLAISSSRKAIAARPLGGITVLRGSLKKYRVRPILRGLHHQYTRI